MNNLIITLLSHLFSEYSIRIRYKKDGDNLYKEYVSINDFWECFHKSVDIIELVNKKTNESIVITFIRDLIVKSVLLITKEYNNEKKNN